MRASSDPGLGKLQPQEGHQEVKETPKGHITHSPKCSSAQREILQTQMLLSNIGVMMLHEKRCLGVLSEVRSYENMRQNLWGRGLFGLPAWFLCVNVHTHMHAANTHTHPHAHARICTHTQHTNILSWTRWSRALATAVLFSFFAPRQPHTLPGSSPLMDTSPLCLLTEQQLFRPKLWTCLAVPGALSCGHLARERAFKALVSARPQAGRLPRPDLLTARRSWGLHTLPGDPCGPQGPDHCFLLLAPSQGAYPQAKEEAPAPELLRNWAVQTDTRRHTCSATTAVPTSILHYVFIIGFHCYLIPMMIYSLI